MSLQLCPSLSDPTDCSPPGCSVYVDSPGRNTGVGCHVLLKGIFPTHRSSQHLLDLQHWQTCSFSLTPPGKSFVSLGRFILTCFILFMYFFDAMVSGIISLISLSELSVLVYRSARCFCVLILYSATLVNSLMSSSSFLVTL